MDWLFNILKPLEIVISYIMVGAHTGLTALGMPAASGWTWALSIVALVVVIRIVLIPLFVKQINASRGLQLIQPEVKKIQAKYKDKKDPESRQKMTQETMALYKETGTNPFASCLPILLQAPIFFALFQVLNGIPRERTIGALDLELVQQADRATIFGAPLSSTFLRADGELATQIVTVVLIILMSATTFTTQKQLMTKNMPAAALDNPFAQQQKLLLYALPVIFAVSGVNFPIGVLLYWFTTNLWSMGQQFYVIRKMPAPGSPAATALEARRAKKGKKNKSEPGTDGVVEPVIELEAPSERRQRTQPKRKDRVKRAAGAGQPPRGQQRPGQGRPGQDRPQDRPNQQAVRRDQGEPQTDPS